MNLPPVNREAYLSAKPFPHLVIDNVFNPWQLKHVVANWPELTPESKYDEGQQLRVGLVNEEKYGGCIADFVKINFHSQKFITFLEQLTGVTGLVLDCREIGLHETFPGGYLLPHLDYIINERTGLQHRVNAILYLNEKWKPEYFGWLELFKDNESIVSIEPIFNRLVIFSIDDRAWHGHPKALKCPPGMTRKSIALNYFIAPQSNVIDKKTTFSGYKGARGFVRQFIPPIGFKLLARLKKTLHA